MKLKKEKIIVVAGIFDALDLIDINFLKRARAKGDWLIVGVHSDIYTASQNNGFIHNYETRSAVIRELKCVDEVFTFNDGDGTIEQLLKLVQIAYATADIFFVAPYDEKDAAPELKLKGVKFIKMK